MLWLAALAALAWLVQARLTLSGDLRLFMPSPETPEQTLLIEELGEGPGSRVLLLAIAGSTPETLAAHSRALRAALADSDEFRLIANGEDGFETIPEALRPYRYLLSPTLDAQRQDTPAFDENFLRIQLARRVEDLGSPAAALVEPLIARDPTLETVKLAERWQPPLQPQQAFGVWFDRKGAQALLLVETTAAGFDPQGQQQAIALLRDTFATISKNDGATLTISGPGAFSVLMRDKTQGEAGLFGGAATLGMIVLLAFAYRSWRVPLLGALPLASAGLAGLAAVSALFGEVHGITLAFGFTLIGVAQDYPVHLFSHQRAGLSPWANVRVLWPTLATGVVSTCIAYLTFLASGVEGLKQLAVFTIVGLAAAALSTRFALPALLDPAPRDPAASPFLQALWRRLRALPRPRWLGVAIALIALGVIALSPRPWWENNLAALTPVPEELLARDAALRADLGAPDVRYLLTVEGANTEAVLAREEALQPRLDALVARGAIAGYDFAARYLPSVATQRARQARLPDRAALTAALAEAADGLPFRAGVFAGFVDDVEAARAAKPLTPADLADTPLALSLSGLLLARGDRAIGLISVSGVRDPAALAAFARAAAGGVRLLDLKAASESLVSAYRERVLAALGVALVLLAAAVWVALRRPRRVVKVLSPVLLSLLIVVATLHAAGVAFNLFHLVALILAAGLGLDYALFFEHAGDDRDEQLRTLHAVLVCSASTLLVFALLALSSIPVLRAIGTTVGLGVIANFLLAVLIARADDAAPSPAQRGRAGVGATRSRPTSRDNDAPEARASGDTPQEAGPPSQPSPAARGKE